MKSEDAMLAEIGMEESGVGEEPTRHVSILHLFIARAYSILYMQCIYIYQIC